jgi:hypothetical protein
MMASAFRNASMSPRALKHLALAVLGEALSAVLFDVLNGAYFVVDVVAGDIGGIYGRNLLGWRGPLCLQELFFLKYEKNL